MNVYPSRSPAACASVACTITTAGGWTGVAHTTGALIERANAAAGVGGNGDICLDAVRDVLVCVCWDDVVADISCGVDWARDDGRGGSGGASVAGALGAFGESGAAALALHMDGVLALLVGTVDLAGGGGGAGVLGRGGNGGSGVVIGGLHGALRSWTTVSLKSFGRVRRMPLQPSKFRL